MFAPGADDIESLLKFLTEYQMPEPPAQHVPSTMMYPELEQNAASSWLPRSTSHQMVQLGPTQSNKPPTTDGTAQENPSASQSVAAEKGIHTAESTTSKADILAKIDEARQRSLNANSSVWVNDAALMNVGLGMHRVRYVTRRTVVAVRKKSSTHASASLAQDS